MKQSAYQCPVCKLWYPTPELAKQCEEWCTKNHSCNLDIIKYAIKPEQEAKRAFWRSLVGVGITALCCFTPILVILLSSLGLSLVVPYLDWLLWPALLGLIAYTAIAYRKWQKTKGE